MPKVVAINPDENEVAGNRVVPRVGKLDTLEHVRDEAAKLFRAARRGDVDASDAAKMTVVLQMVAATIRHIDVEKRLSAVEKKLLGDKHNGKVTFSKPRPVA